MRSGAPAWRGGARPQQWFTAGAGAPRGGIWFARTRWTDTRAIAAAYAPRREDVVVHVFRITDHLKQACALQPTGATCRRMSLGPNSPANYTNLLLDSAFGLALGGAGPYSYRLQEVLAAGAVPLVTRDLVLPFDALSLPASGAGLAWEDCAVRVSRLELCALDDVLETAVPPASATFARRRAACAKLWDRMSGGSDPDLQGLSPQAAFGLSVGRTVWAELAARIEATRPA